MINWHSIEQFFKQKLVRFLESALGKRELTPTDIDHNSIKKILIIRQHDQLGDFILSTPAFRALRAKYPDAQITIVARHYTTAVVLNNRYINKVITFYEHGRDWNLQRLRTLLSELRAGYDLTVVLNTVSHSLTSDLLAWLSGARYILGSEHLRFSGTRRNFFYHLTAPYYEGECNQSERNVDIVRYIGADTDDLSEHITLTQAEYEWATGQLHELGWDGRQKILAIHPGAGKLGNRWPVHYFVQAANILTAKHNLLAALAWGPAEADLGKELCAGLSCPYIIINNKDIRKLAALLAHSGLFLCNDTGVLHVAAAVGAPLVAVFGPTNPAEWKPVGEQFAAVRGSTHNCSDVQPEQVIARAEKLLF
ncbi:MAG TPA: glycosyltransferase family 9 protein [bacterium]|nr:glycosyltransferase family 9 protein [bacterium]HPN42383.1 glycosyltransferase family 9 protein [bacterium]